MSTYANHNGSLSVFLVDDDNMFLKSLEHHLQQKLKHNIIIKAFTTGEACIKSLQHKEKPDIVVLDYYLNGQDQHAMNGVQVLEKIKLNNPDTAVIILSGQDQMQVAIDSMKHGAFDYVVKNENAFLRAQNVIRNAIASLKTQRELKYYKAFLRIIIAFIALLGLTAIIITTYYREELIH